MMAKSISKCKPIGEVAMMEVANVEAGVKMTRARASVAMAASAGEDCPSTAKRRKVGGGSFGLGEVKLSSPPSVSRAITTPENDNFPAPASENPTQRTIESSSWDEEPVSCCSSNGSREQLEESSEFVDLEVESVEVETSTHNLQRREWKRMAPCSQLQAESGELESTVKPSEANSRRLRPTAAKMPSDAELEEFFTAAEKDLHEQFAQKYNYDIVKDAPLEGRYDWVRLKP